MNDQDQRPTVLPLDDQDADPDRMGGKGASLARLLHAGVSVPDGFCVATDAYVRFVEGSGLRGAVLDAVAGADPAEPDTLHEAARTVGRLFRGAEVPADVVGEIRDAYLQLGSEPVAVAVRSSATAEDLPDHSFAGQQETYLNIRGIEALVNAVRDCWASLWTARAIGYRARAGIAPENVSLAVVVQELIPADAAGVAFTADPVTGARERITINAAWGLGEAVVSGAVSSDTLVVDRETERLVERRTGEKAVMTVRGSGGTHEAPVPERLRTRAVLDDSEAQDLARQCRRIEEVYAAPMDIEWARHDGNLFILQARPITTGAGGGATVEPEEWNDSRDGDYLWTSANVGEAVPSVMTPISWSMFRHYVSIIKPMDRVPGVQQFGNIGGRMYMNVSLIAAFGAKLESLGEQFTGRMPEGLEVPPLMPRGQLVRRALPVLLPAVLSLLPYLHRTSTKLARCAPRIAQARERIRTARSAAELARLWDSEIHPAFAFVTRTFWAGNARVISQFTLRPWLREHGVSEADVDALSSGAGDSSGGEGPLASLGPIVGLAQLARGEIDRETFVERWGHRCPDEFELSLPRPAEDPEWLDRQVSETGDAATRVDSLLERKRSAREEARQRFAERHPAKVGKLRRRMANAAKGARSREATRSEWVRAVWAQREFVLRAGELTGHGEDLFYLQLAELLSVLRGDEGPLAQVPARRAAYEHYASLPTYPVFIRGRFDPERWAADPNRRVDLYDEHRDHAVSAEGEVQGAPGSRGRVEATARVVGSVAEAELLQPGEILVTTSTNVGWTPLFPRAAAVVTDVGAPLSHAAIVARELGIPAVVGCGDATTRLSSGDRIRVDGAQGTVEIIAPVNAASAR